MFSTDSCRALKSLLALLITWYGKMLEQCNTDSKLSAHPASKTTLQSYIGQVECSCSEQTWCRIKKLLKYVLTKTGWRSTPYMSSHFTLSRNFNSAVAGMVPLEHTAVLTYHNNSWNILRKWVKRTWKLKILRKKHSDNH